MYHLSLKMSTVSPELMPRNDTYSRRRTPVLRAAAHRF
jgi:hypothetical protein